MKCRSTFYMKTKNHKHSGAQIFTMYLVMNNTRYCNEKQGVGFNEKQLWYQHFNTVVAFILDETEDILDMAGIMPISYVKQDINFVIVIS